MAFQTLTIVRFNLLLDVGARPGHPRARDNYYFEPDKNKMLTVSISYKTHEAQFIKSKKKKRNIMENSKEL